MSTPGAGTLSIDFETASTVDLRKSGVYPYAEHPQTRVLCMAYAFDDEPVQIWRPGWVFPERIKQHVANGGRVQAWNANFEFHLWNMTLARQVANLPALSLAQLYDTMAAAAYYGLPLGLDMAASAARVHIQKDKEGHSLMLRMCRPRKVHADGTVEWWHETDPDRYQRLMAYCKTDVEAERAVGKVLPELPARERSVWLLDARINQRGVSVDLNFAARLRDLAEFAAREGNAMLCQITGGKVRTVNSHAALLAFVKDVCGYPYADLKKGTVAARLDEPDCTGLERDVLELRADVAKTSAAKLAAMEAAAPATVVNGVAPVRGMLQYYGAFRTGRWAGRLIQLQNMPRGEIDKKAIPLAIKMIENTTDVAGLYHALNALFGSAMSVVTSLLRSCIVPAPGHELAVADFAQIEARVLPWLAGQEDVLDVFRRGEDVYKQAAMGIFGVALDKVTDDMRQIGKVAILALGYQGGKGAFQVMASAYGVEVSDARADEIKVAWRAANDKIVEFWWAMDAAARTVLMDHTQIVRVGPLKVGMWGAHMVIILPSDRALFYRDAKLVSGDNGRWEISYMGLNQYTRKWERLRTYGGKLTENVTQAVARDVMAEAMLTLDANGVPIVLTVHDELLTEPAVGQGEKVLAYVESVMSKPPAWAPGLPTGADGWVGTRYKK